jgi:Tfp pilus assembly protein PilN
MRNALMNLLPPDRARAARRNYFLRLAAVGALALAVVIALHAVMLIPSYAYLAEDIRGKAARADDLAAALTPEEKAASSALATLSADAAHLSQLSSMPTMSGAVRLVLSVPHGGIALTGFAFAPQNASARTMQFTGTASTRDSLRAYVVALQGEPWISDASLPISAYAQDTNLPFTISLTGSFLSP